MDAGKQFTWELRGWWWDQDGNREVGRNAWVETGYVLNMRSIEIAYWFDVECERRVKDDPKVFWLKKWKDGQ